MQRRRRPLRWPDRAQSARVDVSVRHGGVLLYAIVMMTALIGIGSLAVDWGYVQCTKSEMQRTADAVARGYLSLYDSYGLTTANSTGPQLYQSSSGWNPIDSNSGVAPTVTVTWGYWNNAFVAGVNSSYPIAMKVTISRKASTSNAIRMSLARTLGLIQTDLTCNAVAVRTQTAQTVSNTIPATSDIWLSGMPVGSTASYVDNTNNAPAYQTTIPVVPGTYLSFAYISGYASNGPSVVPSDSDGDPYWVLAHDTGAENGIAGLTAPIHSMIGVFLSNSTPDSTAAPADRDYSTSASRELPTYSDIELKQPFFIGDGLDSAGNPQSFLVPPGATRLFLGSMDGYEWNNNWGQYNVSVTLQTKIELKQ